MPKEHVPMHETDTMLVDLSETEPVAKLHTSALAGCLAVAATFESNDGIALFLSHHPPSGSAIEAAKKLEPKIKKLMDLGYQPSAAVVIRPGEHFKGPEGWTVKALASTHPDVEGYERALGIKPNEATYIPDHLTAGFNRDKEWGPGTAAIQVALEGEDGKVVTRAYSESAPIEITQQK